MRLKEDVVFGETEAGNPLYIIATDDNRISFIVVPISGQVENMVEVVRKSLGTTKEKSTNLESELLLPLFKVSTEYKDAYVGH